MWFPKLYFWKREALLLVLQLLYVLNFFHRQLPGLLAPELMEAFSLSRAEIGLLAGTGFALFYAMTGIVVAVAGNNWSLRVVIAISVAIWSLAVILTSWATHSWQLFTLRFVFAAAQSAVTPQIYALLAKTEQRTKLGGSISRYASGIYIGLALSFALVGFAFSNWQAYFYWSGVYGIMLAFLFFALTPNLPAPRGYSVHLVKLRILWHDRTLRFHLIGFGLLSMTGYTMLTFASSFIRDYAGGKSMLAVFSLILLGTAVSVVVAGNASDYLARRRTFATVPSRDAEKLRFLVPLVTSVLGAAIYSVSFVVGNTQVVFAFFGAGMIITSSYNGLAPALLQNLLPEILRPVGGAVYLFVVNLLGLAVGPPLAGWIADASGSLPLALFLTMITGNLGAAACFAWILRKNKT